MEIVKSRNLGKRPQECGAQPPEKVGSGALGSLKRGSAELGYKPSERVCIMVPNNDAPGVQKRELAEGGT